MVTVTNAIAPIAVTILNVHPSCGCTTAELPPVPWTIPPGTNGADPDQRQSRGQERHDFKTRDVTTDKGSKRLTLRINILPPP